MKINLDDVCHVVYEQDEVKRRLPRRPTPARPVGVKVQSLRWVFNKLNGG